MNYKNDYEGLKFSNQSGPMMVALDVTGICNFKCKHCYNASGCALENEFTDEELYDVAQQIAELKPLGVCLCGGEPMIRKNLIELIKCMAPHVGNVNMVSNGSLINEKNVVELKEAGIHTLQISLDGINSNQHDNFRVYPGAFDKAVNAIKLAKEVGINVIVSCTPNKLNYTVLGDYIDFVYRLGVSSVRFMPFIPMGRGAENEAWLLSSEEYLEYQLILEAKKNQYNDCSFSIEWGDPLDHYYRQVANTKLGYKTYSCDIKANGDIKFSSYVPFVVGNLRKHSLKEYWELGFNDVWANEKVMEYVKQIENVYDIHKLNEEKIELI